jgi:hypothetical protein
MCQPLGAYRPNEQPMHAVHNAKVQLLATLLNNLALAFIVAGFVAPTVGGQLHAGWDALLTVVWIGGGRSAKLCRTCCAWEVPRMTRDQVVAWLIVQSVVAIVLGVWGIWQSGHIP